MNLAPRRCTPFIVFLLVVALAAAGCGNDSTASTIPEPEDQIDSASNTDGTSATDDTEDGSGGTEGSAGGDAGSTGSSDMSTEQIIELLFPTFDEGSQAEMQAKWEQQERERQTKIAECMRDQGFEYQPVDYSAFESHDPFGDIDYASREFAETYGFGWTTMDDQFVEGPEVDWVDPNQEYLESLSDSARDAYYLALHGEHFEFDETMSEEEMDALFEDNPEMFRPQGCEGEAYEETNDFAAMEQVWMTLGDEMNELYERAQADPRILDSQVDWAECMAGKGHTFTTMDELYQALEERSNELWDYEGFAWPEELTEDEMAAMTDEEIQAYYSPPEPDPELKAEIQDWEIALAVDNWDCGGMDQTNGGIFAEVFEEYQAIFVEENLDAIRAALAE